MAAILMGVVGTIVVGVTVTRPAARPDRVPGNRAAVTSPIWGDRHVKYFGKSAVSGSRLWSHDETEGVDGGRSTSAGFTRVSRYDSAGVEMVFVLVSEIGGRSINCRKPWVGDGHYDGEMVDAGGNRSTVKVHIKLPPIQD
jgi:hypothetical protein